ncbi:gliding motility-associated lipoprotein GldB [Myroides gitamensis]|uniref:gliding motility lipoprotein GldB n=1 Tax=Myroides odoratus TaxID=256 RepID=UPI002167D4C6|nr:gliding motility lipoprotein GldB [Myroides odoratus]MCS4239981.1 gliding motility-associated lipoprotein GldB [Myroides odoratus]MDH6602523.1 gliding motility-associated lipoprotein GldB [Myroides gitamensis]
MFKISKISLPLLVVSSFFVLSCGDSKTKVDKEVEQIPMDVTVARFDQEFYTGKDEEFQRLKKQYPYLFPASVADEAWLEKKQDTIFKELYQEVTKQYSDLKSLPEDLKRLFQYIKYYYPEESDHKKVITLISEVDVAAKAIYADTLALISLDTYLGKDHHFYKGFPAYTLTTFKSSQILPDMAESFVIQKLPKTMDRTFLGTMIHQGKLMYTKELLLPGVPKESLITYTKEQLDWCKANESQIWRYFVDNQLFFDTDGKLVTRFIEPAPFSKFYLDIDNDSPGRVGVWIGWQIVRSFMENNNVTLQELFAMPAKDIFEKSKYKPKK